MRRVLVELPRDDFVRLKGDLPFYRALDSLEVLQLLRAGPRGASSIVRLRPREPHQRFEEIGRLAPRGLQLLDSTSDGSFVCLWKFGGRPLHDVLGLKGAQGYFVPPIEVSPDRARMTYVGSGAEVRRFLNRLRAVGMGYRTLSISDLRLPPDSPLNALTEKQRRVVTAAFQHGYYDRPRRTSSQALARALQLSSSTLVNHRLKAERRLISYILEQGAAPFDPARGRAQRGPLGAAR